MTKKAKAIIFFSLLVSFFTAAPLIVSYSQGYRFDFEKNKFVKTGGLYFKVKPLAAEVLMRGKQKKNTSLVFGTILVENLLPKSYQVEIRKEGYNSWQKTLEVKEGLVTEAKNIILFKSNAVFSTSSQNIIDVFSSEKENAQTPAFELKNGSLFYLAKGAKIPEKVADSVNGFKFSPDSKKAAYFNNYEIWLFYLEEDFGPPKREAKEKVFLTRFSEKIGNLFWTNNYYLLFNAGDKIKVAETDNRDGLNVVDITEFKNPKIFFSQEDNRVYILSQDNLYSSEKIIP